MMPFDTHILDWRITDYFKRSDEFLDIRGTGVFFSGGNTNMAKIELHEIKSNKERNVVICISIKTARCVNQCWVRCYRLKHKTFMSNSSQSYYILQSRKYTGLSSEWKTLVVQNQFERDIQENKFDRDNLRLKFEFIFKKKETEIKRSLRTDVSAHLMNPTFSDITIRTSEGDEVPAHKILLVARSDVFRAHFHHDTVEKSTNIVECPFETNVVKDLLTYIYQDVVPNIEETAFKLLEAADYYRLDDLKDLCEEVLTKKLNVDNAVELLTLAETHNARRLKKVALEFIKLNAAEIVETEGWKVISRELSKNIFEFSISDI